MFTINKTIGYSHLGQNNVVTCGTLTNFLQDCGFFHMQSTELFKNYFTRHNLALFIAYMQTDILKYPEYGDEISITTWIYEMNSCFGLRNYTIYDSQNNLCIQSYAIGAFVELATGKPAKIPKDMRDTHPIHEKINMEYTPRRIELPAEKVAMEDILVRKYHLDGNNHVNNARYVDIAAEFLPDNFIPKRVLTEYKTPAKFANVFTPYLYTKHNRYAVSLCNEQGKPYAIIAFEG